MRRQPLLMIGAIFTGLLLFGSGQLVAQENKDYCVPRAAVVVMLIDITTPYDQADKDSIISMVNEILRVTGGGQRLVIRTIGESHTKSERLIERCIPHCPSRGFLGPLFNCSDGLIRSDGERVRADIIGALKNKLTGFEELPYSDIVRTLVTVSAEELKGHDKVRLFIFSDLIENSDHLSGSVLLQRSNKTLIDKLKTSNLIAPLSNAEVRVAGVGRAATPGRRPLTVSELAKLTSFWKAYFAEGKAQLIEIGQNVGRVQQ